MCPAWKIGSDSILMNLRRPLALVSKRNQRHAICSRLDPDPRGFVVDDAVNDVDGTLITMRPIGAASLCPACGALSGRVHSRYSRRLADLPIADRRVRLVLLARRFRCGAVLCARRIFNEGLTQTYWRLGPGEPLGSTISCIISRSLWAVDRRRASHVV
jgi:zinc-finger of transposase IS204/IS1001/IS1096/IS1165